MPPRAARGCPLGLKRYVRAQLEQTCARVRIGSAQVAAKAQRRRLAKSGRLNVRASEIEGSVRPVSVIKQVQGLCLQLELHPLAEGNHLGKRHVDIPDVRSVEPRVSPKRSWGRVLTDASNDTVAIAGRIAGKYLGINEGAKVSARYRIDSNGVLEL